MKKKLLILCSLTLSLFMFGCTMKSTPRKEVENLLIRYQNKADNIMMELSDYITRLELDLTNPDEYKELFTRQYEDLKYEIKEENIDGEHATVKAQIEVYDYYKAKLDAYDYVSKNQEEFMTDGIYDNNKAIKHQIDALNNTKERVIYTIDFSLTKVEDKWNIDILSETELEKIHGTYAH